MLYFSARCPGCGKMIGDPKEVDYCRDQDCPLASWVEEEEPVRDEKDSSDV